MQKFSVIDFTNNDLRESFSLAGKDIEDNIHYFLSQKRKCKLIITNDHTGFSEYGNVIVINPREIAQLKRLIQ